MTDQERKAMEMALDALEWHEEQDEEIRYDECPSRAAMDLLRQALAQGEQDISYTDIQMAELIMSDCGHSSDYTPLLDRIAGRLATYRQALAQPEQEPVAWIKPDKENSGFLITLYEENGWTPLYTAPPSKPWVSLTDEDFDNIYKRHDTYDSFARAIETALRSKNNG